MQHSQSAGKKSDGMTNNKICNEESKDNEIHNQILRLEACDGRDFPFLTLGNWQDGENISKSALMMEGAVPSLSHDNVTN